MSISIPFVLSTTELWSHPLSIFHNHNENRIDYTLKLENDNLIKCAYSVNNCLEKEMEFIRISAPPSEEEKKKYKKQNNQIEPKNAKKIDILKEYAEYGDIKANVKFEFKFNERENMLDIIEKYNLDELVKGKNDVETAIALMRWLCGRYKHGVPPGGLADIRTPQELMAFADKNGGTVCRGLALILVQLIRAYNIKAFHVTCYPYEQPFDDCHVVVCVYCESLGKYIMLDPTSNIYMKNKNGEIIGVEEFRDILIADEETILNEDYFKQNWNVAGYRDYMAKNLIRIERYNVNGYGEDGESGCVVLIPEKYMQNEVKNFFETKQKYYISSREDFWQ